MRTSEVAAEAGVNTQTLRYYERRGLLPEPERLASGGPRNCDAARAAAEHKIGEIEEKIARLRAMRESLARLVDTCTRPRRRRECPLLESLESGMVFSEVGA